MDLVSAIFANEINSSGFAQWENRSLESISSVLESQGYQQKHPHGWTRESRRVYLRLVDSIDDCVDINQLGPNDLLITDNFIGRATAAQVLTLPDSWYGIYSHDVTLFDDPVSHDYSFLVNRIDPKRLLVMIELSKKIHLHQGLINFNCVDPKNWANDSHETRLQNLNSAWQDIGDDYKKLYHAEWQRLVPKMPYINHFLSHDQAMQRSRVNIVMETYSNDDIISFSEKTFRALVLPIPWTLFAGRYAIQRLQRLGFDTLSDIVDHQRYDGLQEWQHKHKEFISASLALLEKDPIPRSRLIAAAIHNQNLLKSWRERTEKDFQTWLNDLQDVL